MASVRPLLVSRSVPALLAAALLAGCGARPIVAEPIPLCERCHGGNGSAAPPRTARGLTETSVRGVGAHRRHLQAGPGDVHAPYPCETCHVVPTSVDAHLDGVVRVRLLDPLAAPGAAAATWNPASGRCENVACHGAALKVGTRGSTTAPEWTVVDGTQMTCGSCHKDPPDSHALYAERTRCQRCHPGTVKADGTIDLAAGRHIDGATPVSGACDGCHDAPPRTGAHLAHANVASAASAAYGSVAVDVGTSPAGAPAYVFGCGFCHPLDAAKHRDGHVDVDVAPDGGGLKALNDPTAVWDPAASRCSGVYCHGATLRAGTRGPVTSPDWTVVDGSQKTCASCHLGPPASHALYATPTQCHRCHPGTVAADGSIDVASRQHIDGATPVPTGCNTCHDAPPATGAHLAHANVADPSSLAYGSVSVDVGTSPAGAPAYVFGCGSCHPVDPAKHRDGHVDVDVAPDGGGLKALNALTAAWDPAASRCSGVYCHGATLRAGSRGATVSPDWTVVDGSQKTCASCHAAPPASHAVYATPTDCHRCHSGTVAADGSIDVAGRQHIDGSTPVPTACNACHDAPPRSGAHLAHANVADPASASYGDLSVAVGTSPAGAPAYVFGCGYCHPLAGAMHRDGLPEVDLSPAGAGTTVRSLNAPGAAFDPAGASCSGVYCHGATLKASTQGPATAPTWTVVDGSQKTCGACHLAPPGSHATYPGASVCQTCHTQTVLASGAIDYPGRKHVDGIVEAPTGGGCTMCHGAPPDTGAHRAHANPPDPAAVTYGSLTVLEDVSPSGGPRYDFGCGHCHPIDPARHALAAPAAQLELGPPATPVAGDEIKARNDAAAAYDGTAKTCNGVYCHSSGQQTPAFVASPAWNAAPGALGCNGCHANPPRYASEGPGLPGANSHLVLGSDGFESGHFHGLPGPWHGSYHGGAFGAADPAAVGKDAAPITCETCHAETVDPAAHGPSGFYWLDTTGDYFLPGGLALSSPPYGPLLQCTACHDGAVAPLGAGKVLPLRHVNGKRDVVFDRRTVLPAISWLPGAPNTPTRPYWGSTSSMDPFQLPAPPPPDAIMEGVTFSAHLASAAYDPATKTCSTVACHLGQTQVQWGDGPLNLFSCGTCHTNY